MKGLFIFTSREKWKSWSDLEKLEYVGFWIGFLAVLFAVYTYYKPFETKASTLFSKKEYFTLNSLRSDLDGFEKAYWGLKKKEDQYFYKESKDMNFSNTIDHKVQLFLDKYNPIDLNNDGVPELTVASTYFCGSGGCDYPIYSFDKKSKKLVKVGDVFGTKFEFGTRINGWSVIKAIHHMGACEDIKTTYSYHDGEYKEDNREKIINCSEQ